MDVNELNEWIRTDEGQTWLNEQKKGLIDKRDQLLASQKELNEQLKTAIQRADDAEKMLKDERGAIHSTVVGNTLDHFITGRVAPQYREAAKALLTGRLDTTVKADGQQRIPMVGKDNLKDLPLKDGEDGLPDQMPLTDYLDRWTMTEEAKAYLPAPDNSGGGARGGSSIPNVNADDLQQQVLQHMGV